MLRPKKGGTQENIPTRVPPQQSDQQTDPSMMDQSTPPPSQDQSMMDPSQQPQQYSDPSLMGLSMPIMNQTVPSILGDDEYDLPGHTSTGFPIPKQGNQSRYRLQTHGTPESGRVPIPSWWDDEGNGDTTTKARIKDKRRAKKGLSPI